MGRVAASMSDRKRHERDYIERTIETVRNHRDADNCWPQWANFFADEIEDCWAELERVENERDEARKNAIHLQRELVNAQTAHNARLERLFAERDADYVDRCSWAGRALDAEAALARERETRERLQRLVDEQARMIDALTAAATTEIIA
jgi:hypothetical protein